MKLPIEECVGCLFWLSPSGEGAESEVLEIALDNQIEWQDRVPTPYESVSFSHALVDVGTLGTRSMVLLLGEADPSSFKEVIPICV